MDRFMAQLQRTTLDNENVAYSENGAQMYGSTGSSLLDLNFAVSRLRSASTEEILNMFLNAYHGDPISRQYAMKWLFYARDVRQGLGERRLFRTVMNYFATTDSKQIEHLLELFPEYGRWDDLVALLNTPIQSAILRIIKEQFIHDNQECTAGRPISLMAKWIPNVSANSIQKRKDASTICKYLELTPAKYRKQIAKLRRHIDVVEVKMSANEWSDIEYDHVPGRANKLYSKAFMKHDPERREAYIRQVLEGNAHMNAGTVYPHEIVHQILSEYNTYVPEQQVLAEQAMWNSLPPIQEYGKRTIVVSDGSGSMKQLVNAKNSSVSCLDVAMGLSIYFSQFLKGPYKDQIITFSAHPRYVDLSNCPTIQTKVATLKGYTEVANTNIEAVFDLILRTAVRHNLTQDEIPENILIISDMEFDSCVIDNGGSRGSSLSRNLFESIRDMYRSAGYKLPRICFWNVRGISGVIPMKENELGCALMSGFSINNVKLVMSQINDPLEALLDILNSDRYARITPPSEVQTA